MKTLAQRELQLLFIAALFTIIAKNETTESVTHTHNGNYSTIKRRILTFVTPPMDTEGIMLKK